MSVLSSETVFIISFFVRLRVRYSKRNNILYVATSNTSDQEYSIEVDEIDEEIMIDV